MPQSRKRSGRAAMRARYRKPRRRRGGSMGWNVAIAAVVIVGVVLIALTRDGGESGAGSGPPFVANAAANQPGSHWHTYLGVNICGEWLPAQPEFTGGIHTHGDALVHTHPHSRSEAGNNATLGKYAGNAGWSVSSDSIEGWTGPAGEAGRKKWSNGDTCTFGEYKGENGRVVWAVDDHTRTGNPGNYRLRDGEALAIGFLPDDAELEFPLEACAAFATVSGGNISAVVSKDSPCRFDEPAEPAEPAEPTEEPTPTDAPADSS